MLNAAKVLNAVNALLVGAKGIINAKATLDAGNKKEIQVSAEPIQWRDSNGNPISCLEKTKVLNENLAELLDVAQESFDDAVLMGVDAQQVREVMANSMHKLITRFPKS